MNHVVGAFSALLRSKANNCSKLGALGHVEVVFERGGRVEYRRLTRFRTGVEAPGGDRIQNGDSR
jgi:hypothetical protein